MSHVLLIGFMGAGKSRVGAALAARLDQKFVDLDTLIETREGMSIPELFTSGEDVFRDAEHEALQSLIDVPDSVIACGGGIVVRGENRALLGQLGRVVYLSVSAAEALARIGDTSGRPLLAGDGARLAPQILNARLSLYRAAADFIVDTSGRDVSEVLKEVVSVLDAATVGRVLHVDAAAGYDVRIGPGALGGLAETVKSATGAGKVVVVSDTNVAPLYGTRVVESLSAASIEADLIVIEAGEPSKDWETAGRLVCELADRRLGRDGAVVALGGGVVGDIAGFAAAVYVRGIPVVQVPTTLLAQVDSSLGGKTGVDLPAGKNLAGAFWQPSAVVSDTTVLATLPDAEWTSGLVEVAKSALLAGEAETAQLESAARHLLMRDHVAVQDAVLMAAGFKASVVGGDERESGDRECLNLGHTLGHAIERVLGYGVVSHGIAVAAGMRFAARLAEDVFGAAPELTSRTEALLDALGATYTVPADVAAETLFDAMLSDKKTRGGVIRFVLLRAPGDWAVVPVEAAVVMRHLERLLRAE
ncbi:MAG: 3-dehydroquinate synthase [Actinobacteria bacterium HGW-Actinobacteria-6]|nr:MAG: 3-dehydroquinate synthase [Actinobacteria bacterium HGW-Actinobacteria-6]